MSAFFVLEAAPKPRRQPQKQTFAGFHTENCRMDHAAPWLRTGSSLWGLVRGSARVRLWGAPVPYGRSSPSKRKDTNSAIVCVLEAAAKPRRRPQKQTLAGFHAENCRMVHATPWLRSGLLVAGVSAGVSACLLVGRACALWAQLAVKTKKTRTQP